MFKLLFLILGIIGFIFVPWTLSTILGGGHTIGNGNPADASSTAKNPNIDKIVARAEDYLDYVRDKFFNADLYRKTNNYAQDLTLKYEIYQGSKTEWIWVDHISYLGEEKYSGSISTIPHSAGYRFGQKIVMSKNRVRDWLYIGSQKDKSGNYYGKLFGGETMRYYHKPSPGTDADNQMREQLKEYL